MDNGPGVSLFQGNEGIQLNSSIQQQEEEEAIEDERRRNEEIKNLLSTAFDDLSMDDDDDDRTTVNSSFHSNGYESNKSSIYENRPNNCDSTSLANRVYEHVSNVNENDEIIANYTNIISENKNQPGLRSILKNSISSSYDNNNENNNKDVSYYTSFKNERNQFTLPRAIDSGRGGRIEVPANHHGDNDVNDKRPLSPHHSHCYRRTSVEGKNDSAEILSSTNNCETRVEKEHKEAYMATRYNSVEQLQLLYDIRLKEIQSLKDQLDNEHKNSTALKDDLSRKLMLAEADKEGALLSYKQTSELLAWSKGKISDLEREVSTLKQNIVNLEKSRSENIKELETARGMITELQQKLAFLERSDGSRQTERQFENTIKSLENKHLKEITCLTQKLDNNNLKLKQKDDEIKSLEERLLDLQGKMGSLMVEKSDTVTALMRDLEESQSQCRQLMASNVACENVRLQQKLDDLFKEKEENNKLISSLRTECSMLKTDLEQLDSISRLGLSPVSESDSMVQLGLTSKNGNSGTNMTQRCDSNLYLSDTNNKLKDELHRALLGQRAKRSEIKRLQEKLDRKENQITEMKKQERIYLSEVETLKNDMGKLTGELKSRTRSFKNVEKKDICIQTHNDFIDLELENKRKLINEIENEKERLKQQLNDTEKLLQDTRDKLAEIEKKNCDMEEEITKMVKSQIESKEIEFRIRLEEKNKECDELKKLYIELRSSKDAICKKLEYEKDVNNNMNADIKTLKAQINDYNNKMKMKDELISKYKIDNEHKSVDNIVKEKEKECFHLKEELKSANNRHSSELDGLRKELNIAKDRVIQLEKKLRVEFTNEMYKYQTEISSLQSIIKDKELCLKELTDKLNMYTGVIKVDKNTFTEDLLYVEEKVMNDNDCKLLQLMEKHSKELQSCKDEAAERIISIEKIHKEALDTIICKTREEINKVEEKQKKIIFALKKQLIEQEELLKTKYIADLALAENKVKDITVKYFAEEIKKIENRHRVELELVEKQIRSSSPVSKLERILIEKNEEIEKLGFYKSKYLEAEDKINTLAEQIDADRNATAELMTRWAKEVQDLHKQMSEKQMLITEMKEKLKKVKKAALHFRQELKTYKQKLASEMKRHQYEILQQLQDKIQQAFDIDNNKDLKEFEEKYSLKEIELRRKLNL